jgi:hypothetical protein
MKYTTEKMEEMANGFAQHSESAMMIRQLLDERIEILKHMTVLLEFAQHGYRNGGDDERARVNYAINNLNMMLVSF